MADTDIAELEAKIGGDGDIAPPDEEVAATEVAKQEVSAPESTEEEVEEFSEETAQSTQASEKSSTELPSANPYDEYLKAQVEAAKRQTELLEKLTAQQEVRAQAEKPKEVPLIEQYQAILNDGQVMSAAMKHPSVNLNPADANHVALFRNLVHSAMLEEQSKVYTDRLAALETKIQSWEQASHKQAQAQIFSKHWSEATKQYAMDADIEGTLREAASLLVEGGTSVPEATQLILTKFGKLLPKKGQVAPNETKSAAVLRAVAAPARGNNKHAAEKLSISDLEKKIFGS